MQENSINLQKFSLASAESFCRRRKLALLVKFVVVAKGLTKTWLCGQIYATQEPCVGAV